MSNDITLSEVQEFIAGFWYHYDEAHFDEMAAPHRPTTWSTSADPTPVQARSRSCCRPNCTAAPTPSWTWLTEHRKQNPYPLRHHATNILRTGSTGASPAPGSISSSTRSPTTCRSRCPAVSPTSGYAAATSGLVFTAMK